MSFDKPQFEDLMGQAVQLHNQRHYEMALEASTQAYNLAPNNSFEKGRAARDNSARCDRLGRSDEAQQWAEEAYVIHDGLVKSQEPDPTSEAYRERSVSAMYLGVSGLRKAIQAERDDHAVKDPFVIEPMRQTWSDIQAAKSRAQGINRKIDQYEINASRRVSMAESLLGDKKRGVAIGSRAVVLSMFSESPRLDTTNPNLTSKQRLQAKAKALAGGLAAVGCGLLASSRTNSGRQLALKLAEKSL